jgi:glutamine synthetase
VLFTLTRTGLEGPASKEDNETKRSRTRFLPDNVLDAIRLFKSSEFVNQVLGENVAGKYAELKQMAAERCPKQLGTTVKAAEVMFHHEVTNQYLWSLF